MEPEAHFIVVETEEATHKAPARRIEMDAAFWGTFALLLVAICLTVTGESLLKTGMNRYGELNVRLSTLVPTAVKLFTNPFVAGGCVFGFSGALFWRAVLWRWLVSGACRLLAISYISGIVPASR